MELLFVRHAQPAWVDEGMSCLDPKLTDLGFEQAARLGERAAAWDRVDEIWVSPTRRTQQTAAPIVERLGLEPKTLPWLEEIRLPPEWDGVAADRMGPAFAAARQRGADAWWDGISGGETFHDFLARVTTGLEDALSTHGMTVAHDDHGTRVFEMEDHRKRVVVVGHGGTNSVAIAHLLGLPAVPWSWERFVLAHASISRMRSVRLLDGRIFGLREHSDVAHLTPELVTR